MSDDFDDDDLDFEEPDLWTDDARVRLNSEAIAFAAAVLEHAEAVAKLDGSSRDELVERTDKLVRSALSFSDAQFDLTGSSAFGPLHGWFDDDDEDEDGDAIAPTAFVSIVHRTDYAVVDEAAVIDAGLAALERNRGPVDPDEAQASAGHLGGALYCIAHESDWSALRDVDGLVTLRAVTEVIDPEGEVSGNFEFDFEEPDPLQDRANRFVVPGERLFGEVDQFFN